MTELPLLAGVELGGTKCICILGTEPGDVREEVRVPTTTPAETLGTISAVLARWRGYAALGIASFGPVSLDRQASDYGHITATPKRGWAHIDVVGALGTAAGVPTGFDTDVAGAALGEGRWGASAGLADHAYVTVGTGIGVGLVLGGEPIAGLTHAELGHVRPVRIPGDDWPGACPYHGDCIEGLASGPAIRARTGIAAEHIAEDDLVWIGAAHALAQLCHALVLTGIPRRIVMGGGLMVGMPHLFPLIREHLATSLGGYGIAATLNIDNFVVPAALSDMAGPLGALEVARRALVSG